MPTWKSQFNELSTAQSEALEAAKRAKSQEEWISATEQVQITLNELAVFFRKFQAADSPNHDDEIPSS